MNTKTDVLDTIRIITLATNLPGPAAASRLLRMGASVTKIEPPGGDFLKKLCPSWYESLSAGQEIRRLDLKTKPGFAELEAMLEGCDLLITSMRPSSLEHLSLDWKAVHCRHPHMCHVAIVGYDSPDRNRAGHDLTYLAPFGLLIPPNLPRTLLADLVGTERTVSSALCLLYAREKGRGAGYAEVSLARCAEIATEPLRYGLTVPNGMLGGGLPHYNIYETRRGWIALAALEPHFWDRLTQEFAIPKVEATYGDLQKVFMTLTAPEWEEWATHRDIPIVAVHEWT
jgi:crotonobetainyl-CoA:carnitine CoA-transferase CaiB-like acyl-CoA transferase